ncbi:MBL fold metallo-hydrolase [Paenibacillus sp. UNC451MF]|uniref:MBL fold metallo-hydrolase n=1 Tax=Paenibacillus sp. UNC451MF TaxID=1449063 RepID=UPI00048B5C56|nr:MBL fold metallo-hydrolase [Paenibacillus sp. UNC451MF]
MKIVQISDHIWKCTTWIGFSISAWVVKSDEGLTLVDSGIPWMANGLQKCFKELQAPLRHIVLTHGHSDHVGGVKRIREQFPVPVYVHEMEIPYMEGQLPFPGRKKAEKLTEPGLVQPLDTNVLSSAGLTAYHTPGHSPGHTVFYHEQDGVLLAGDLFTSKRGMLNRPMPMFTSDMKQAIESGAIVKQLSPKRVSVCHGGDVSIANAQEQYEDYVSQFA